MYFVVVWVHDAIADDHSQGYPTGFLVLQRSAPSTMAGCGWAMLGMPKQWQNRRGASCVKATMYRIHTPRRCQVGKRHRNAQNPTYKCRYICYPNTCCWYRRKSTPTPYIAFAPANALYDGCYHSRRFGCGTKAGFISSSSLRESVLWEGYVLCQEPRKYITIYAGSVCIAKMNSCAA